MQSFIDVHIALPVDAAELAGLLIGDGMMGVWEQDRIIHLYWDDTTWDEERLGAIKEAIQQLGVQPSPDRIAVQTIPWQDWNAKWTELVEPIWIGQRILVRPSWTNVHLPENCIELILDPKQAFGTGHHITTQLLGEWLELCVHGGERVLDVGTGSGLLAMVALRLGAVSALGVDHDSVAIDCAKEYARVNHFGVELELRTLDIRTLPDDSFDLIVANLDRRTLLSAHQLFTLVSNVRTVLLLSGILISDQHEIVEQYAKSGWRCLEVRRREDWVAIQFQRVREDSY